MKIRQIDDDKMNLLFKEATLEAARKKGQQFMEEVENDSYLPSFQFSQRIQQVIRTETSRSQPFRFFKQLYLGFSKVSVWILLALIVLLVTVSNVAAARDWFMKLVIDTNPRYATYYLQLKDSDIESDHGIRSREILTMGTYYPTYLPEGMLLSQLHYDGSVITYQFMDDFGNIVSIEILGASATISLDNEDLEEKTVENINGLEARYTKKLGQSILIWSDEDHIFTVSTNLSKEEILRIGSGLNQNK